MGFDPAAYAMGKAGIAAKGDLLSYIIGGAGGNTPSQTMEEMGFTVSTSGATLSGNTISRTGSSNSTISLKPPDGLTFGDKVLTFSMKEVSFNKALLTISCADNNEFSSKNGKFSLVNDKVACSDATGDWSDTVTVKNSKTVGYCSFVLYNAAGSSKVNGAMSITFTGIAIDGVTVFGKIE